MLMLTSKASWTAHAAGSEMRFVTSLNKVVNDISGYSVDQSYLFMEGFKATLYI